MEQQKSTVHPDAIFELEVDGCAFWDLTEVLSEGPGRYPRRPVAAIERVFVHKSGANGPPGWRGALGMARFVTTPEERGGRGWPGAPYQIWIPRVPDVDGGGRLVAYRTQRDDVRSWHSGGHSNGSGVGVALQGAYDGQWDLVDGIPQIEREPTDEQWKLLEATISMYHRIRGVNPSKRFEDGSWALSGHWESAKPKRVCPGDAARYWVEQRRGQPPKTKAEATTQDILMHRWSPGVRELNHLLWMLGYEPGDITAWEYQNRMALEAFQRDRGLEPDGWLGPKTAEALDLERDALLG